jgi:hypothetical protein
MPVIAKVRDTAEVMLNGKVIETHVREGVFLRTSTGSELRRWTTKDGVPVQGEMAMGSLLDKQHNVNYTLDYQGRNAYVHTPPPATPPVRPGSQGPHPLGETIVQGLTCTLFPIYRLNAGESPTQIGRHCLSKQYDLDLRQEMTLEAGSPTGKTVRQRTELYDIQLGVEPDSKLFDLEPFTVYRPDAKN